MTSNEISSAHSIQANMLREDVAKLKERLRNGPDRAIELQIAAKEKEIAQRDRDHGHLVRVKKEREAEEAERIKRDRAALEQRLMDDYIKMAPGTTTEEAKAALPDLLHRHRLAEQDRLDAAHAEARRRIGTIL